MIGPGKPHQIRIAALAADCNGPARAVQDVRRRVNFKTINRLVRRPSWPLCTAMAKVPDAGEGWKANQGYPRGHRARAYLPPGIRPIADHLGAA